MSKRCLVKFKMCHSKAYRKIYKTSIRVQAIVAAILDQKSEFLVSVHFYEPSKILHRKQVEDVFEIQFACKLLKLVSGIKPWYAPLNAENSLMQYHFWLHSCICTRENKHSGFCFEHYFLLFYAPNFFKVEKVGGHIASSLYIRSFVHHAFLCIE